MRFCTFVTDGEERVGAATARGIVDLTALGCPLDMNGLIAAGETAAARVRETLTGYDGSFLDASALVFGNVTAPGKIVCVGLNYRDHAAETGGEPPEYPVLFSKFNDALAPAGAELRLPDWLRCYDYEAELVIVVGKRAYNIAEAEAGDYIFGYTCGNDLSARDAQFLSGQWLSGKTFPGSAPAGPFIVTPDEFDPDAGARISCQARGDVVQEDNTANMIFSCRRLLSAASRYFPLDPGDLIFTGTPSGVILGKPKNERVWLAPGDTVTVTIEGLGSLVTKLV